jgi:predicted Zn-dependent protease
MYSTQQVSGFVSQVLTTKYGRSDELESDEIGAHLMYHAGYDPREILGVMQILKKAGGGGGQPEMLSTHPLPDSRIERLKNEVLPKLGVSVE